MRGRRPGSAPACRRCGHERDGHAPYVPRGDRPGFCKARAGGRTCGCWQYQPERLWTQLLAWFRRDPAPVEADVLWQRPVRYPVPDWAEDDDRTQFGIRVPAYLEAPRPRGESQ